MTTTALSVHDMAPARTIEPLPHGPGDLWRQSWSLAKRALINIKRVPESLIDVTLQPVIFTLLFSFIFGGAVSGSIGGYLKILIPGIVAQSIAFASMGIGVSLRTDMDNGIFDRFRSLPIARVAPLLGQAMASIVRYALLIAVVLGTGMLLGYRVTGGAGHFLLGASLLVVFATALSWGPMLVGLLVRSQTAAQGTLMMILFPLTFASNAFVPTESMPGWLRTIADHNPISYLVQAVRALWTGVGDWQHATVMTLGWSAALMVILMPLAIRAYNRKA
jgi:oleandomycin transport system permease protein